MPRELPVPLQKVLDAAREQRDTRVVDPARKVEQVHELVGVEHLAGIVQAPDRIAAGSEHDALVPAAVDILENGLGVRADVGVHIRVRLVEARDVRLDPHRIGRKRAQELDRGVLADIADHAQDRPSRVASSSSRNASKRVFACPSWPLRRSMASPSRASMGTPSSDI